MDPLDPLDGRVVEDVRPAFRLGQRGEVLARIVKKGIDHAGDQHHLADRLPVLECAPTGGQFEVSDLTPLAGLPEDGSHDETPVP